MKILIVSGFFYPQNTPRSFRTTELVKEFSRQGHQIVALVPELDYDYTRFLSEYENVTLKRTLKINERRIDNTQSKLTVIFKKIMGLLFEYPEIKYRFELPKRLQNETGYDLLISVAAPHSIHWGVARAVKKNKLLTKKWIADCGDPFMFAPLLNIPHPFYFKYLELSFCKRADYITVPLETAKAGYYPAFHPKIKTIPQAFNFDEVKIQEPYTPNKIITFGYAGSFIKGQGEPMPILDYLLKTGMDFRFIVYTKQKELFDNYLSLLGEKLILRPYVERPELLFELSKMDFLLALEYPTSIINPSKLIDYALTKRPILPINSQCIDELNFFQFLNRNYSQQYVVNNIEDYNVKNVTKKMIDLTR